MRRIGPLLSALGLTAAFAVAPPLVRAAEPVTISVVMTENEFIPDLVQFQAGVHYRLHLENVGKELHEFTAPEFFKTADIANPSVMNADRTDVVLQPHGSKDLFLVPNKKGTYDLRCADHDWDGMIGTITVN